MCLAPLHADMSLPFLSAALQMLSLRQRQRRRLQAHQLPLLPLPRLVPSTLTSHHSP